jgi:hypothetical protein
MYIVQYSLRVRAEIDHPLANIEQCAFRKVVYIILNENKSAKTVKAKKFRSLYEKKVLGKQIFNEVPLVFVLFPHFFCKIEKVSPPPTLPPPPPLPHYQ